MQFFVLLTIFFLLLLFNYLNKIMLFIMIFSFVYLAYHYSIIIPHFGEETYFVNMFLLFHLLKFIFFIFLFYFLFIFLFFYFYFYSLIIFFREDMENAIRKLDDTEFKNPYDSTFIRVKSAKGGAREYVTSYY